MCTCTIDLHIMHYSVCCRALGGSGSRCQVGVKWMGAKLEGFHLSPNMQMASLLWCTGGKKAAVTLITKVKLEIPSIIFLLEWLAFIRVLSLQHVQRLRWIFFLPGVYFNSDYIRRNLLHKWNSDNRIYTQCIHMHTDHPMHGTAWHTASSMYTTLEWNVYTHHVIKSNNQYYSQSITTRIL